ncbi:MAG TPA: HlyD family efflux transporter periplasmic adaptor subunit [Polyangiaceae bacterium]|nr:HlyD family efflux transporter periplasmic adaptor subunit [Polyangiaceae bacterium]
MPAEVLRVAPPWATWSIALSALLIVGALLAAAFTSIEVTSLGRGILQASGSPQVLTTQAAGAVQAVAVRAGEPVAAGQEIVRLTSATSAASLLEASRQLGLAERGLEDFRSRRKPRYAERARHLRAQSDALGQRAESARQTVERMERKAKMLEGLRRESLATPLQFEDAAEEVAVAQRGALAVEQDRARVLDQLASVEAEAAAEEWKLVALAEGARARRDGLELELEAAVVRAPSDGVIGSISVKPGDAVAVGAPVGRLIPAGAPRAAAVYLPERDRAFVEPGAAVRVELDQLPAWEFGALNGRVLRVATEIATARDLQDTFGDHVPSREPMYRVDVGLEQDDAYARLAPRLRAESLADVRFTLRRRRVIAVLFEPLQRWWR